MWSVSNACTKRDAMRTACDSSNGAQLVCPKLPLMGGVEPSVPYRSDQEALRLRLADLELAVSELEVKVRELETLRGRADEARRARDALRELVQQIDRCRGSVLEDLRIASPCHERWSDMIGDDVVRHCARCDKHVYDLSSLPRAEAERVVREREGTLCVRFFRRTDGTVLTADCPEGAQRRRRRRLAIVASGIAGVGIAAAAAGLAAATLHDPATRPHEAAMQLDKQPPLMGDVANLEERLELEAQLLKAAEQQRALVELVSTDDAGSRRSQ